MGKKGKGWTLASIHSSKKLAFKRAKYLRDAKGVRAIVQKGTKGVAWFKPKTCYRVWVK